MPNVFKARFSSSGPHEKKLDLEVIQVCFAQTAALGGFCAEGWATGEETYGLSEWRSRRKWCSQYNIATYRKFRECNIFPCEIYEMWCFGTYQTNPECFLVAILAQHNPEHGPPQNGATPAGGELLGVWEYCILQCWRRLFLGFLYISAFSARVQPL